MNSAKQTDLGVMLEQATDTVRQYDTYQEDTAHSPTIHVPNVGNTLLFAYEQLRNASENIQDHLLFQRAILRFYKRNLPFGVNKLPSKLGHELIIELTQAEYLKNDSVPATTAEDLDKLVHEFYTAYWMLKNDHNVPGSVAQQWILELLSVKSEQLFNNPIRMLSFAHFAHAHFVKLINVGENIVEGESVENTDYQMLLYISIHKALLKSDDANIRNALLDLYGMSTTNIPEFIEFNKKYDILAELKTTARVSRLVSKNGAPLRIIRSAFFTNQSDLTGIDIKNESKTLSKIDLQVDEDYKQVKKSLSVGVIKSIIFLLITKALIGLVIEIPYDIIVTGSIVILPLVINLLFPPIFIAITALTFKHPSEVNKLAIVEYVKTMIYESNTAQAPIRYAQSQGRNYVFNTVYVIMFLAAFYLVAARLAAFEFNIVQGIIFFIFLSTASFLGYRLTVQIKELEIVNTNQGILALIRDFLYSPFIFVGQRISYRFSKMNIIAQILDVVVELPLKTVLKLIRQWTIFLNNKKDELI
jgi:hypothetical protein